LVVPGNRAGDQVERNKLNIVSALRDQILRLEGFRTDYGHTMPHFNVDPIQNAFPGGIFPTGCTHEFLLTQPEDFSATGAFISALVGAWIKRDGVIVWVSTDQKILPSALPVFGVAPEHVLFVQTRDRDALWVTEEALKCQAVTAVIAEVSNLTFTASRRLQLAVEHSRKTGFVIRWARGNISTTACVSRWKIQHLPSDAIDELPGVGFPIWNVELLRVRNGKPGRWQVRWGDDGFEYLEQAHVVPEYQHRANLG
jgi:protein ImuA